MKFAVLPAGGLGDALMMQIAAKHLDGLGVKTVTFSKHLMGLKSWFPGLEVREKWEGREFDGVILQHDNSEFAEAVRNGNGAVYTLFAGYVPKKHGLLKKSDVVLDRGKTMAENIAEAMHRWFPGRPLSLDNGLKPISGLVARKWLKRVVLHPTSSSAGKNWLRERFLGLRDRLRERGFEPVFVAPPQEAAAWGSPVFPTVSELAAFVYESGAFIGNDSGPGHLAANLGLPTLTVGPSAEQLALWRPGWGQNAVCHAPNWVQKLKLTRTKWQYFVSINSVFKGFMKLTEIKH